MDISLLNQTGNSEWQDWNQEEWQEPQWQNWDQDWPDNVNAINKGKGKGKGKGKSKGKGKGKFSWKGKGKNGKGKHGKGKHGKGKGNGWQRWPSQPPQQWRPGGGANLRGNSSKRTGTSPSGVTGAGPCQLWISNRCTHGDKCKMWHTPECLQYKSGNCRNGNDCIFIHDTRGRDMSLTTKPDPKPKGSSSTETKSGPGHGQVAVVPCAIMDQQLER